MNKLPLEGIRICDFCWVWAGPTCTRLLAYLGAEVIKIESWDRLDPERSVVPRPGQEPPSPNQNVAFNCINLNKMGITLNLKSPRAIDLVKEIVKISDIVSNNFASGVMERLGLGYDVLRQIRPDIIMLSMSGFGSTGPYKGYHGYASTFDALGGLTLMSGYPDGAPIRSGAGPHTDIVNGFAGAYATLIALNHRKQTGEGQFIDLSEWEVPCFITGEAFLDFAMNQRNASRRGNLDNMMAPHNCYPCRGEDKWVSIAIATEEEWQIFCKAIENPEWSRQRKFADAFSRWKNQAELDKLIGEWTKQRTHYEVMEIMQKVGVAAIPSFNYAELVSDPHVRERQCLTEVEHPEAGKTTQPVPPWRLSATPAKITHHSPMVGEHNEHVFLELLGLPVEEFASLVGDQVIN